MNKTTAIFLIEDRTRCVSVAYKLDVDSRGKTIPSDVKSFKTLNPDIKVDDLVVIPTDTRLGFTVGKVTAIDLHVDFDSPEQMRWIVSKVDEAEFKNILEQEARLIDKVADANREARKKALAAELLAHTGGVGGINLLSEGPAPASTAEPRPFEQDVSGRGGSQAPGYDPEKDTFF